jgi:hypothetical protein
MARPRASPFKASPGPDVVVMARSPAKEAPMADDNSGNFILCLKGLYTEMLVLHQFVQNIGGRGNRVRS